MGFEVSRKAVESHTLGDRLTVGQWPLKPLIGVRFPVPQQKLKPLAMCQWF